MERKCNLKIDGGVELKALLKELLEDVEDCYDTDLKRSFKNVFYSGDRSFRERCTLLNRLYEIFDNSKDEYEMQRKLDMVIN